MIDRANVVTLYGILDARPKMGTTPTGEVEAAFWLRHGSNEVECVVVGDIARNIAKFGCPGAEILAQGELAWVPPADPVVEIDTLAFVNIAEIMELAEATS